MMSYLRQIPKVRAQRQIEALEVATFSLLDAAGRAEWLDDLYRRAGLSSQGTAAPTTPAGDRHTSDFTFNGVPVTWNGLRQGLGKSLGSGAHYERSGA